jgi:hypothetical protein
MFPTIEQLAKRGKGKQRGDLKEDNTPEERRTAMTWSKRLKRVFNIDIVIWKYLFYSSYA